MHSGPPVAVTGPLTDEVCVRPPQVTAVLDLRCRLPLPNVGSSRCPGGEAGGACSEGGAAAVQGGSGADHTSLQVQTSFIPLQGASNNTSGSVNKVPLVLVNTP